MRAMLTPRAMVPQDLIRIRFVTDPRISPDGRTVAFVLTTLSDDKDEYLSNIWVVSTAGGEPRRFTTGPRRDTSPRWSPDGSRLAFISEREPGKKGQLHVMPAAGGEATRLTDLRHGLSAPEWSPDGTRLAFAARVGGPPEPESEEDKRKSKPSRVITTMKYRFNGEGFTYDRRSQVFVVAADGGEPRQLTEGDHDHVDPVWSPDDRWIAFVTDRAGPSQVFRKPAQGLGEEELIFETEMQLRMNDWSPDGRHLSLGVLDNDSDTDLDVALYDLEDDELEILAQSPFFDSFGAFSPDGRWLAYVSSDSGQLEVFIVPVGGGVGRFQVSTAGGLHPQWEPGGTKLYYVNPLVELMEVDLDLQDGVEIGLPRKLFDIRHPYTENRPFQVMPDGESFLTVQLEREVRGGALTLVQNWVELLSRD